MSVSRASPFDAPWMALSQKCFFNTTPLPHIDTMSESFLREEDHLHEATHLLNGLWLAYREETYADLTDQIVWKSPKRLILRSGCTERTQKRRPGSSSPLMVFPEHLCRKPVDKPILLNFLQCNVAVKHMQCLLEWLLKGSQTHECILPQTLTV